MRILSPLLALAVLGGNSPATALMSFPAQGPASLRQSEIAPELVARRRAAPYRYRDGNYRYPYEGPQQYRQYVTPETRAAPMERAPPIAPLSPRIGK